MPRTWRPMRWRCPKSRPVTREAASFAATPAMYHPVSALAGLGHWGPISHEAARSTGQAGRSNTKGWPAPRDGWIANLNLAQPGAKKADGTTLAGAKVLDNMFPTATGVLLLRGSELYATLGQGDQSVTAMFSYVAGSDEKMFAATETAIYDITTILNPANDRLGTENEDVIGTEDDDEIGWLSTEGLDLVADQTGGNWISAQFATA